MSALTHNTLYLDAAWARIRKNSFGVASRLVLAYEIYCERREMRNLSDEALRDIGIDRAALRRECSRSITDIPENRS